MRRYRIQTLIFSLLVFGGFSSSSLLNCRQGFPRDTSLFWHRRTRTDAAFIRLFYTRLFPTAQFSVFSKLSVCVDDSRISWDESLKDEDREISLMFQTQQWKGKKWLFLFELLKSLKWPQVSNSLTGWKSGLEISQLRSQDVFSMCIQPVKHQKSQELRLRLCRP